MDNYGPLSDKIIPIPIRGDVTFHIYGLPFDLTKAEAEKVARVIRSLAQDEGEGP